jgi:transposase
MHAYSQDLRERVLRALERGDGVMEIAKRFEVSRFYVRRVRMRLQSQGVRTCYPMGGHRRSRIAAWEQVLRGWIAEQPDITLARLCERLAAEHDFECKPAALWHQLNKWGLTFKKNSARRRATAPRHPGLAREVEEASAPTRPAKSRVRG